MKIFSAPSNETEGEQHVIDLHGNLGFASDTEEGLKSVEGSHDNLPQLDTPHTETEEKEEEETRQTQEQTETVESQEIEEGNVSRKEEEGETERVNQRGVRFTVDLEEEEGKMTSLGKDKTSEEGTNIPYGLPCVRELFRSVNPSSISSA